MKKLFNTLFATFVIKDLEFILDAYNEMIRTNIKGDNEWKFDAILYKDMHAGICCFCINNGIRLPKYILKRHYKHLSKIGCNYWYITPGELYYKGENVMEGIIQRSIILEKELKHHKKWRFLAKYIKP